MHDATKFFTVQISEITRHVTKYCAVIGAMYSLQVVAQSVRLPITTLHFVICCVKCVNLHCKKFGCITGVHGNKCPRTLNVICFQV